MTLLPLQSQHLGRLPGIRHGFFTREGGVSDGSYTSLNGGLGSHDDPANVAENRRRIAQNFGASADRLVTVHQVHSPDAAVATTAWDTENRPRADAIVTATPGLVLGITTADCGPVLFADAQARVIGAAHAGWRGALTGVLEATLTEMEQLGASRSDIIAAIGPLIRQRSYEVGSDFATRFTESHASYGRFFAPAEREGHAMFDLAGFIRARLEAAGVRHIDDIDLCTYADERFFSYRRTTHRKEPDYGRHIHAIMLAA